METIFVKTENSKTNESHKFAVNLSQRLVASSSNKHVSLQNLWYMQKYQETLQKQISQSNTSNMEWWVETTDSSYSVSDI